MTRGQEATEVAVSAGDRLTTPSAAAGSLSLNSPPVDWCCSEASVRRGRPCHGKAWKRYRISPWPGAGPDRHRVLTEEPVGSLYEHVKKFVMTATAGWVAVVLERAGYQG